MPTSAPEQPTTTKRTLIHLAVAMVSMAAGAFLHAECTPEQQAAAEQAIDDALKTDAPTSTPTAASEG